MATKSDIKEDSLTSICSVCGSPAAAHLHYGAVSCYSCRAFFRRGQPKQIRCIFGHGNCQINPHNRTNCKLCRYNRCLEVGMKPDKVDRFLVKRKEREAQVVAAEDVQHDIQEPNRSPSSEASFQLGSPVSPNTIRGFEKEKLNDTNTNSIEITKKQIENTDDLPQPHVSEQNNFCNNLIGFLRNIQNNLNEPSEKEQHDKFSYSMDMQKQEIYSSVKKILQPGEHDKPKDCSPRQTNWNMTRQITPWPTVTSFSSLGSSQHDNVQHDVAINATHDMYSYMIPSRSCSSYHDGVGGGGWWPGLIQGEQHFAENFNHRGNKTSVIARNYLCNTMDSMEIESKSEFRIKEVKEEIDEPNQRHPSTISNYDQYYTNTIPALTSDCNTESFYNRSSVLKRKHTDMNTACVEAEYLQAQNYQPYRSVIQRNTQNREQLSPRHIVADFKEMEIPRPVDSLGGALWQSFDKQESDSEAKTEVIDNGQGVIVEGENGEENKSDEQHKTLKTVPDNNSFEDEVNPYSPSEGSFFPLKKRQRMMEIPYSTGHGINRKVLPVMSFTFEEEFRVMDYIVRIEEYQNRRFEFLNRKFQRYKELTVGYVACTQRGRKIPFNKALENKLFSIGLEFTKQTSKEIFEEIEVLNRDNRIEVINCTYPALYVVMWAILEGNTRENNWMDQHMKTLHITKENHAAIKGYIQGLENVRSISLKDQERFTSPWAVDMADEEKFERTVSLVGRLLRDDIQLQALYHMLVMMKPSEKYSPNFQPDPMLLSVQNSLCQFIYRYLAAKDNTHLKYTKTKTDSCSSTEPGTSSSSSIMEMSEDVDDLNPDQKTKLLISLVDDLHDCVDIMQNRSLLVQTMVDIQQQ